MTGSAEAWKVAVQVRAAYTDMVSALSGPEAAHAHEHLVSHLHAVSAMDRDVFAVQARFGLGVLDLLMGRVIGDAASFADPEKVTAGRDCTTAREFVNQVLTVMRGAMGVGS